MFDALCEDSGHYRAGTPLPVSELRRRIRAHADALDEIETSALVHFDLWTGNIVLDLSGGRPEISGVGDGERARWGDPVADFVSLPCSTRSSMMNSSYGATVKRVARRSSTRGRESGWHSTAVISPRSCWWRACREDIPRPSAPGCAAGRTAVVGAGRGFRRGQAVIALVMVLTTAACAPVSAPHPAMPG